MQTQPENIILCVEDEPAVLDAVIRDLAPFEAHFRIEAATSVDEARKLLETWHEPEARLALVLCDHLMPGTRGTDFLIELNRNPEMARARKVLLTAQAGLEDTIRAVNQAGLHYYLAKPWTPETLRGVVVQQLTDFVIERRLPLLPFMEVLDQARLAEAMRRELLGDR